MAFNIRYLQNGDEASENILPCPISLESLKVKLGVPALPEMILTAEDTLLDKLNLQGFASASIKKRDTFADQKAKNVIVWLVVETGPLTYFGPLKISGLERVKKNFSTENCAGVKEISMILKPLKKLEPSNVSSKEDKQLSLILGT